MRLETVSRPSWRGDALHFPTHNIFATNSTGLPSSNFRSGFENTYFESECVGYGRSRSSKVVDIGTNRKHVCDFLSRTIGLGLGAQSWLYYLLQKIYSLHYKLSGVETGGSGGSMNRGP